MRVVKASLVALGIGAVVAASVNFVPWWNPLRFWGIFFGFFAAFVTFGLALMVLDHRRPHSHPARGIGRIIAAVGLLVFGGLVAAWILMWRVTPLTLEGAWIYPSAAVPLFAAVMLLKPRCSRRRGRIWDRPPG